jgi:hypothetical protein
MSDPPAEPEPEPAEPEAPAASDPPRRRVLMSAGARTIEVEGPDDLDAIAHLAVVLWKHAGDPAEAKLWAGGMGFAAELATQTDLAAYAPDDDRDRDLRPPGIGRP